ncbi:hypothetical protein [Laceyella tengchongensis]
MGSKNYVQFQFTLPSLDLNPGFVEELANVLDLPYDEMDFEEKWFNGDETSVCLIQDPIKDTNTFILVNFNVGGEFDELVLRFRSQHEEKVKEMILELWKSGYASVEIPPNFMNVLDHPEYNWVPKLIKRYNLKIDDSWN